MDATLPQNNGAPSGRQHTKSNSYAPVIGTARDLISREIPPTRYIANGLIAEGLTIFAGNPKLGKSWAMLNLALAVAFGGAWLGSVLCDGGDVLYLALEDNERRMKTRLVKCLHGERAPDNFYYATEWRRIDEGGITDLINWLKAHPEARLIVIDTLQKIKPRRRGGGNVYEQDSDDVGALKALADKYGIAIVCVHHRRKGQDSDDLEGISGSYGLTGAADGIMSLKRERGKSDAVLTATGRDLEEEKELALKFDSTLGSWSIMGEADEYRISSERDTILSLLRDSKTPLTPKQIAIATGKKDNAVRFLLFKMAKDDQVEALGGGRYSLPSTANTANATTSANDTNKNTNVANNQGALWGEKAIVSSVSGVSSISTVSVVREGVRSGDEEGDLI